MGSHELETAAVEDALDEVHGLLARAWQSEDVVAAADRMAFETAVAEVAANIVEHASRGEPVRLRLVVHVVPGRIEAHFEDRGRPFETRSPAPGEDLAESGRGLELAHALVDEVLYERDGPINRWVVVRRRAAV